MIFQAVFNILDLYFQEADLFYLQSREYFRKKMEKSIDFNSNNKKDINKQFKRMIELLVSYFIDWGMDKKILLDKAYDPSLKIKEKENNVDISITNLFNKKVCPLINEIIFEEICEYVTDTTDSKILVRLHEEGVIPLEFLVEIRDFHKLISQNPDKKKNFKKYILSKKKIIEKFENNKKKIESLEKLKKTRDKLQLFYLVYRLIEFFNLHKTFHYDDLGRYIKKHTEKWVMTLPLVSLKNPDLYFCGIYLAKNIDLEFNKKKINKFIINLWKEIVDEFESPIIEGTSKVYYFIKSLRLLNIDIGEEKIKKLINFDSKFFEEHYLRKLQTSQLVVIVKLCKILDIDKKRIGESKIKQLEDEIKRRITTEGIKLNRDGLISSEATYYVIFFYYMQENLEELKELNLVETLISRIHRNIEIMSFSSSTNYDLVSEVFYSCEALKLFNCIENKVTILLLSRFLFPKEITKKVKQEKSSYGNEKEFWHKHIDMVTGETKI